MTGCHTALMRESGGKLVLTPTEAAYVDSLRTDDRPVVDLNGEMDPSKAARRTIEAMEAGADVIVQATFLEPEWHGRADILERVPTPSRFGDWSYQVTDTQLCLYSEMLAKIQDCRLLSRAR